jgi:hypothetical protein
VATHDLSLFVGWIGLGGLVWSLIAKNRHKISSSCNISSDLLPADRHPQERVLFLLCHDYCHNSRRNDKLYLSMTLGIVISWNLLASFLVLPAPKSAYQTSRFILDKTPAGYVYRFTGQGLVNVFNNADLMMNNYSILLCRITADGLSEMVPFQDISGGRLKYLQNDYLYYLNSLSFQRGTIGATPSVAFGKAIELSSLVAEFDSYLVKEAREYKVLLIHHEPKLDDLGHLRGWRDGTTVKVWTYRPTGRIYYDSVKPVYFLPANHSNTNGRTSLSQRNVCNKFQ